MEYIKIRFGKNLEHMHNRLQKTIDEMFRRINPMLILPEQTWRPQMDIYETSKEIIIIGEISGVDKEDLEVELDQNAVKISGRRQQIPHVPGMRYHLAEIAYGSFERILLLPVPINPEKVTASYTNGFLKITMAKKLRDQVHRIPVVDE
ncbi:MAG: Hsp20/alpha crystallin family protein [Deltaproteobacteria bacterium]|nr:Hsp20/alpha crystallin family protein [Deltaproteobacteria bacterium]MBW2073421.1 Hsp20/alpha crystallin family protein [Deltaproteobacteria bacterium]RLB83977.1 MAG: Hsp20/alpha crystallin family protein [Deltaproteobacteria bacterium]